MRELYECAVMEDALSRYLGGREFDVAHVHHMTGLSTGAVGVLQAAGIPTVVTLHDYWIMCPRGQMWHKDEHPCEQVEKDQCAACLAPLFGAWLQPGSGRSPDRRRSRRSTTWRGRRFAARTAC